MNYEEEHYVRVYTRDTKTWMRWEWQGQTVFMHVLRRLDRAGILDDIDDPVEDVALLTKLPVEMVKVGLERVMQSGTFTVIDRKLIMPNYIDGQTAKKSDAVRARESRARRRADALSSHHSENRDAPSQIVTLRHKNEQIVTRPFGRVTHTRNAHANAQDQDLAFEVGGSRGGGSEPPSAIPANDLELMGLVRAPEPDEVELCPRSATRSAPPTPESAATGQPEVWSKGSPWYGLMETQPIKARCEWLLLQKHSETYYAAHQWPEVMEVWDVFLDAQYGQRHAKLTNWSSDCQAIVKLFAAGYDLETIRDTIPKCVSGSYFAHQRSKGQKPGMSTITPVVFARELPGKEHTVAPVRKPKIGEEGYRRQSDGGATIYDFMAPAEVSSG